MRYKLNPEAINQEHVQQVRGELRESMCLDQWLSVCGPRIRNQILDIMAVAVAESAAMLNIPVAQFSLVRRRRWDRNGTKAEISVLIGQKIPTGRDRVRMAEWYMLHVADQLSDGNAREKKIIVTSLREVIAHEQYHAKESRTTPKRYLREEKQVATRRTPYAKAYGEKAAILFARSYKRMKRRQATSLHTEV